MAYGRASWSAAASPRRQCIDRVSWFGRDRRRGPRPPGAERELRQLPTYIVERDAPPGAPIDPMARWHRRAVEFIRRVRVDAYPDHLNPFEDVEPPPDDVAPAQPLDPAIAERLPKPKRKVRLMVASGHKMREVHIEPFSLSRPDLWTRGFLAFLGNAIRKAIAELGDDGQGLAEYALILALVAIVAIVVLLFLGAQISDILNGLGQSI